MLIALVTFRFSPATGGAENWLGQLAGWLAGRGHQVLVFCEEGEGRPGVELAAVGRGRGGRTLRWWRFLKAWQRWVAERRPEISHTLVRVWPADFYQPHHGVLRVNQGTAWQSGATMAERRARSLLKRVRPGHRVMLWAEARMAREVRHWGALSSLVAAHMMDAYRLPVGRIHLTRNGIDLERFHPRLRAVFRAPLRQEGKVGENEAVGLFVAYQPRLKGLGLVLRAMATEPSGRAWKLWVVSGRDQDRFRAEAARLGIGERLQWLDPTPRLEEIYAAADFLIHPTWYDSCSLVVLEALASGLPVISTSHNGAAEIIRNGEEGWVVSRAGSVTGLLLALEAVLQPEFLATAPAKARRLAERFPLAANFEEIEKIYRKISDEKGRA